MTKKKPQHLYELLGQKAREAQQSAGAASPVKPATGQAPAASPRRYIPADPTPLPAPVPVGPGQERALENMVVIRRDTAIVGSLLVLVAIVVAFVAGRATAKKYIEDNGLTPQLQDRPAEAPFEPTTPEGPPVDQTEQEAETAPEETAPEEPAPPAAAPAGNWAIVLVTYVESETTKSMAEDVAKFVKDKGFPAEVVKWGSNLVVQVTGFESTEAPEYKRAMKELSTLEYRGAKPFEQAYPRKIRR